MYYIYKIENLINHKIYIGLTNNIVRRKTRHFTDLRHNHHDNHFLQKEFNIYGEDNFSFTVEFEGDITQKEIRVKKKNLLKNMIVIGMDIIKMKAVILERVMVVQN